jgi:hypothetical protein
MARNRGGEEVSAAEVAENREKKREEAKNKRTVTVKHADGSTSREPKPTAKTD